MATVTFTVDNAPYGIDQTSTRMVLRGVAAFTGTYAAGGATATYAPLLDASGQTVEIPTLNVNPDEVILYSTAGSGWIYQRANSSGNIQIFGTGTTGSALSEHGASTVPTDTVHFVFTYVKQ